MKTIAVMNQKGGTGKTTSAINLAGELVRRGKRVLLIDMDTQGNATSNLQLTEQKRHGCRYHLSYLHRGTGSHPGRKSAGTGTGFHAGNDLRPGYHAAPPAAPDPGYI